jgi:hypothetical protein
MVLQNFGGVLQGCCCGQMELRLRAAAITATAGAAAEWSPSCLQVWGLSDGDPVGVLDDKILAPADLASVQRSDGLWHMQHK